MKYLKILTSDLHSLKISEQFPVGTEAVFGKRTVWPLPHLYACLSKQILQTQPNWFGQLMVPHSTPVILQFDSSTGRLPVGAGDVTLQRVGHWPTNADFFLNHWTKDARHAKSGLCFIQDDDQMSKDSYTGSRRKWLVLSQAYWNV